MTLRQHLFNNSNGVAVSVGNCLAVDGSAASAVTPGTGGTITYSSSFVHQGSTSIFLDPGTSNQQIRLPFVATSNSGALSAYHSATTLPPVLTDIINVRHSGGQLFRVGISPAGAVLVRTSTSPTTIVTTPDGTWAINRWNRIEAIFNNSGGTSAGTVTLAVYNVDSLTAESTVSSTTGNLGTAVAAFMDIGSPNITASTWNHSFDSVQMDDGRTTFIGPYLVAPPAPVVNALSPLNIGPGQQKNIVASLSSGSADSWTWRQVSGPTTAMNAVGNTLTITGPSILPPANGTAVFGVKAVDDGVESAEVTATATIIPQRNWTRVPGGNWVGSRVVPV